MRDPLEHAIGLIAEAKMYFILTAQGTVAGSPERAEHLVRLERTTTAAREHVESMGGLDALPKSLAVALRVCEKGLDRLRAPEAQS